MMGNDFLFRVARPEDKGAVVALSRQIWDGHDYVPDCFDEWVADSYGEFTLVYEQGRLMGFGKLTRLGPQEWWLEGLRVDPAGRGRGIARLLHQHAVQLADQLDWGMLRFATSMANGAVRKIAQESGFRDVAHYHLGQAAPRPGPFPGRFVPAAWPQVHAHLQQSAHYLACGQLLEDDWVWLEIEPRLAQLEQEGRLAWWLNPAGQPTGLIIFQRLDDQTFYLNYGEAPAGEGQLLAQAVLGLAAQLACSIVKSKPLATPTTPQEFADWQLDPTIQLALFERPLSNMAVQQKIEGNGPDSPIRPAGPPTIPKT